MDCTFEDMRDYGLRAKVSFRNVFLGNAFLMLIVLITLPMCKHEPIRNFLAVADTSGQSNADDTSICFERDILPIFITNCATPKPNVAGGCHDPASHKEDLVLNTYNGIMAKKEGIIPKDPNNSEIYQQLNTGKMSKDPYASALTQAQKDLIKRWILEGAKDGKNCPSKCDTSKYTFSGTIMKIMDNYCRTCHNPNLRSGNTDLSSYDSIRASALSGKLMPSLYRTKDQMPLGATPLSDCQKTQIQHWIDAKTPNN